MYELELANFQTLRFFWFLHWRGYYDQAHFIHDFRAFSGFTPSDYLARNRQYMRHVPLD